MLSPSLLDPSPDLFPNLPTPTSWPCHSLVLGHMIFTRPRASPPIDGQVGHPLLHIQLETQVHSFNPSTWEAEAGRFLSLRPAWSTEWVPRQPGLYRETPFQKKNQKKKRKRIIYLFYVYKYIVAIFRHTRRGHLITLQMVVSYHMVAGNWT